MENRIARIVLPHCYPVMLSGNFHSHWGVRPWTLDGVYGDDVHEGLRGKPRYRGVQHHCAPKLWPWWLLIKVVMVRLEVQPSTGTRWWIYTRWGAAFIDLFIDRRPIW